MFRLCPNLRTINLSGASSASATGSAQYMLGTHDSKTELREVVFGPEFGWPGGGTNSNTNNYWPAPGQLTATAEDPFVVKCSLAYAQAAVKRGLTNLLNPLKDGRVVLKNLQGHEFLYNCEKSAITSSAVLTDPDA